MERYLWDNNNSEERGKIIDEIFKSFFFFNYQEVLENKMKSSDFSFIMLMS